MLSLESDKMTAYDQMKDLPLLFMRHSQKAYQEKFLYSESNKMNFQITY